MCKIPDFLKELSRKFCYISYTSICWRLKIAIFEIVKIMPPLPHKQNYTGGWYFRIYEIFQFQLL